MQTNDPLAVQPRRMHQPDDLVEGHAGRIMELGRKTRKERPERLQEVNREIEAMGARVTHQYAVLGGYDFINILEAPDNETVARISVELGSRGTVVLTTLPALPSRPHPI
jgi:uncharacterized protein with GYD domain